MKEKIGVLTVELEKSKADNVKLYGKIRYVQDYNHEKVISRGSKKVFNVFLKHHSISVFKITFFPFTLNSRFVCDYMYSMLKILKVVSRQMLNLNTRRYMRMI